MRAGQLTSIGIYRANRQVLDQMQQMGLSNVIVGAHQIS
jgi:hypothetical protein